MLDARFLLLIIYHIALLTSIVVEAFLENAAKMCKDHISVAISLTWKNLVF